MQRLPLQHMITANTEERKLPNGNSFYLPVVSLDVSKTLNIEAAEQTTFSNFLAWVDNYNNYIIKSWAEKTNSHIDDDDKEIVDDIVDIELEDEDAA
jgi:hypothetical protein